MTLEQFLGVQAQMMDAFGWFIRWWLILFGAAGVIAASVIAVLLTSRGVFDKT